ncbi:MAG: hypothetical protein U0572_02250 [Phycisphaerales bacterium]
MKVGMTISGLLLGGGALVGGYFLSQPVATAVPRGDDGSGGVASTGPDVIVGAIPDVSKWGSAVFNGVNTSAYSFGSTSCNIGNVQLDWQDTTNQHPVIPQNMYRLKDGRFEQIGMSWVKHGFCALQQTLCGTCTPAGSGCPHLLGIGCSDPYDSNLNGQTSGLGPRSQINAASGFFPYPFSAPSNGTPAVLNRRLQVPIDELNPSLNPGAQYFAECQYVHPDDAAAGNDNNNASYRKFTVGSLASGAYTLSLSGSTFQQKPAIYAWQAADAAVTNVTIDVADDGRFLAAYKVTDNGNGTWHYEYAISNLNSDRSGGSFSLPIPAGVNVTNIGFHDIAYHSGEAYSSADWTGVVADGAITWSTESFATNQNANALRWATLYNFRFDADMPPTDATATLGLFKPGTPSSVTFAAKGPTAPVLPCVGDFNGDGQRDGADLGSLLGAWGTAGGDLNADGTTDAADLAILLGGWGPC